MAVEKTVTIEICKEENEVEKLAILLALTDTQEEEKEYIKKYMQEGYVTAVTGISGMNYDIQKKIVNSVIGACLNNNVIQKTAPEMHAMIHATSDAAQILNSPVSKSFQLKAAVVRKNNWICVALYGNIAIHKITNHKTMGVGVMHI